MSRYDTSHRRASTPEHSAVLDVALAHRILPAALGQFRRGTVWVSDDADLIPLRAEVEIFVGYVFGELTAIRSTGG